jgi:hypothetical protein
LINNVCFSKCFISFSKLYNRFILSILIAVLRIRKQNNIKEIKRSKGRGKANISYASEVAEKEIDR